MGEYKQARQLPVLDVEREKQVLEKKRALVEGPELKTAVTTLYETIMGLSRRQQRALVWESGSQPAFRRFTDAFARAGGGRWSIPGGLSGSARSIQRDGLRRFFRPGGGHRGTGAVRGCVPGPEGGAGGLWGGTHREQLHRAPSGQIYDLLTQYEFYIVGGDHREGGALSDGASRGHTGHHHPCLLS